MHNWVDKEKNGTLIWMEFKYELTHLIYKICKFYKKKQDLMGFRLLSAMMVIGLEDFAHVFGKLSTPYVMFE